MVSRSKSEVREAPRHWVG